MLFVADTKTLALRNTHLTSHPKLEHFHFVLTLAPAEARNAASFGTHVQTLQLHRLYCNVASASEMTSITLQ